VHYFSCTKFTVVNPIWNALTWFMRFIFFIGGHHQVEGHPRKDLPACFINERVQNKKIKLGTRKVQISKEHQQTEKRF
jgi:hypothetical protein